MILLILMAIAVLAILLAAVFVWSTNSKRQVTERDYYD